MAEPVTLIKEVVSALLHLHQLKDEQRRKQERRIDNLANSLNKALTGEFVESTGMSRAIGVFRLADTETSRRLVHICQDELHGYLNEEQLKQAAVLFPTRGKALQVYIVSRSSMVRPASPAAMTPVFRAYLLANVDRIAAMAGEVLGWDYVRFTGQDLLPRGQQAKRLKTHLETTSPDGTALQYFVARDSIRTLMMEWRRAMRSTEEELRRLRMREHT